MHDLGTLPGRSESFGTGINRSGQIVGFSRIGFDSHAFLYSHGAMQDLNDLISSTSGWVLEFANAINDRGQITGTGNHGGEEHAFRLTPISDLKMDEDDNDSD
jgi:probable HAF family extracellular repeat protein